MSLSKPVRLPAIVVFTFGLAAGAAQGADAGRYRMQRVDGGVVRLDTRTGAMTLCLKRNEKLDCGPADDERKALTNRIGVLEKRVEHLEAEMHKVTADAPADPTDRQLDEAVNTAKRVMRHFFGMVQDLQKELRRPAEPENGSSPGGQRT